MPQRGGVDRPRRARRGVGRRGRGLLPAAELPRLPRGRPRARGRGERGGRALRRARRPHVARRARGAGRVRVRDRDRRGAGGRELAVVRRAALRLPRGAHGLRPAHAGSHRRRDGRRRRQARRSSSRCRPASSTSAARRRRRTSPRIRRCSRSPGSRRSRGSGPQGLREVGETCLALAQYARERVPLEPAFDRRLFKEVAFRTPIPAREVIRRAREHGVQSRATRSVATTRAWTTCCSSRSPRSEVRRGRRPARRRARGGVLMSRARSAWRDAPLIFERSRAGRRAGRPPRPDLPVPELPDGLRRARAPRLPELAEPEIVRHFTALADRTFGVDTGFYPLGSCTMKHNPRVNERAGRAPRLPRPPPARRGRGRAGRARAHVAPAGDPRRGRGLPAVTLQPAAGSQGELTGLMLMRAYFADRGEERDTIITADTAHGTNPASVTMAGYKLAKVETDARGNLDLDDLRGKVNERTAGLMLTNPSTLGLFDEGIEEVARIFHDAGALLYYDGANLNAVVGISRPGDMGFDIVHYNLHKTFSQPHGGGGPGGGPGGGARDDRAVPARLRSSCATATRSGSTTTGRSRSDACAASRARSASSSARTRTCARTGRRCARCPRSPCSTRTTCSRGSATRTTSRTTVTACTSSCSRRGTSSASTGSPRSTSRSGSWTTGSTRRPSTSRSSSPRRS